MFCIISAILLLNLRFSFAKLTIDNYTYFFLGPFLYHLYDDRGLDVLGGSQKLLLPLYHQFHDWILEYDLEKIDQMFAPAKE